MATIKVDPGICGLMSSIEVSSEDGMNVTFKCESECPHVVKMVQVLESVNGYEEGFAKYGDGKIAQAGKEHLAHGACPVPTAMLKGLEVVCSLALPKDAGITIES